MTDQPVVMAVATYSSVAAAEQDFHSVRGAKREGEPDQVAAAVLEKGADGKLEIHRHGSTAEHLAWGGALLGGAITVVAAPLGIDFLAPSVAPGAAWAGVGAIVGHFWHNVPREQLRRMGDLLEAGQAALVVVAVDHSGDDVAALLPGATDKIVTDSTQTDFEAEFAQAIDEARSSALASGSSPWPASTST